LRANPREDAIDQANSRRFRRHERADLGEKNNDRHLPQVGALATHVGTSDEEQPRLVAAETAIVWHERLAGQTYLDDRMAPAYDFEAVAV
jgi:hypothetical protein